MSQESEMFEHEKVSNEASHDFDDGIEEYTPKPPRGRKRRFPDDLIETALTTLNQIQKHKSPVKRDVCRSTGEKRVECVANVMKLLALFFGLKD